MRNNILSFLKKTIQNKNKEKKINNNFNIIKSKTLDSIDILEIITEIEKMYKIKFKDNELINLKNMNINELANFIKKK